MDQPVHFSRSLKSSKSSLPSPNGEYVATVLPSKLTIRETRSLEIVRVITLPPDLSTSVVWFTWSSTSKRLLVASADQIRVCSAQDAQFSASIANSTSGVAKMTYVSFGSNDEELCVFSDFGLKMTVFNLATSKSIEINSPKLFNSVVASNGFSYRPGTGNMALLTRSGGKDIISIHARGNYELTRSWLPDTIDAHGLLWSFDGRFVAVWESPANGHKLVIYTADGHIYKVWSGPRSVNKEEHDLALGAGIRLIDWSRTGTFLVVGDHSQRINILTAPSYTESSHIRHGSELKPSVSLQIWQEQVCRSEEGGFDRQFVPITQTFCPPTSNISSANDTNTKTGTKTLTLDISGNLLATRTENMPTAVWIWNIAAKILRTVLILHSPVAKLTWHPSINELLMIRCEGEESRGLAHLWDPSWLQPKIVDFANQLPEGKIMGRSIIRWLNVEEASPSLFFSDSHDCILAALPTEESKSLPWQEAEARGYDIYGRREESPLNLVQVDEKRLFASTSRIDFQVEYKPNWTKLSGQSDKLDDTFHFRKFVDA